MFSAWFVFIASSFPSTGFSGRNNPDLLCTGVGIDNHKDFACQVGTESDKALFIMVGIFNGDRKGIIKDRGSIRKGYPMIPEIVGRF
jgi:hypothetical protein